MPDAFAKYSYTASVLVFDLATKPSLMKIKFGAAKAVETEPLNLTASLMSQPIANFPTNELPTSVN